VVLFHYIFLLICFGVLPTSDSNIVDSKRIFVMRGEVIDSKTGNLLEEVSVAVSDLNKTFVKRELTDKKGSFRMDLPSEGTYTLVCAKKHYFHSEIYQFSTVGKNPDEVISVKIPLIKAELGEAYVLRSIDFEVNSTNLQIKNGKGSIDKLVAFLRNNEDILLEIGAHTDARGDEEYNLELSTKRARAVRDYIISKGIENNRITFKGYGEEKLLNECSNGILCSSEKHLENRRIEFRVIAVQAE